MENQVSNKIIMSGFGEPEPVLEGRRLFEYDYCPQVGEYYEYPYDIAAVASLYRATSHHTSALVTKRNVLTSLFVPSEKLSRRDFESSPPHRRLRKPNADIKLVIEPKID